MKNENHDGKQGGLEDHSLPGTNQAVKGPSSCDEDDQKNSARPAAQHQNQLEQHSLPGTNQAEKA
jgi:hypothetical protein